MKKEGCRLPIPEADENAVTKVSLPNNAILDLEGYKEEYYKYLFLLDKIHRKVLPLIGANCLTLCAAEEDLL